MQLGNLKTNHKVKANIYLPEVSVKNDMMWECHVDDGNESIYDIILGRNILTSLGLNFQFSNTSWREVINHLKGARNTSLIWVNRSL